MAGAVNNSQLALGQVELLSKVFVQLGDVHEFRVQAVYGSTHLRRSRAKSLEGVQDTQLYSSNLEYGTNISTSCGKNVAKILLQ